VGLLPGKPKLARLKRLKAGKRALALLQIGERWRADQELQPLVDDAKSTMLRAILAVSISYQAPRAAVQSAHRLKQIGGEFIPSGLYPKAPWKAKRSYRVDQALYCLRSCVRKANSTPVLRVPLAHAV
jgi:hypothetical protein